ncbi:MAG: hypothetical protein KAQ88_11560, partial [Hyphomicrobiaceae bacterium]|nr:hypothetical protein [Hyphomicrobiaceae bacterium]
GRGSPIGDVSRRSILRGLIMSDRPKPPTMSAAHRVEQIGFEIRRILGDIDRHERRIKELQVEVQALISQVQGHAR